VLNLAGLGGGGDGGGIHLSLPALDVVLPRDGTLNDVLGVVSKKCLGAVLACEIGNVRGSARVLGLELVEVVCLHKNHSQSYYRLLMKRVKPNPPKNTAQEHAPGP
jgi:hypothetical protein